MEFYIEKAHVLQGFKWINPVHEILEYSGRSRKTVTLSGVTLHHYPDSGKSRASYLPLLELAVKENPFNDRNVHYLGREYMFYGKYDKAIETLERHLSLPSATWADERGRIHGGISRAAALDWGKPRLPSMVYARRAEAAQWYREAT